MQISLYQKNLADWTGSIIAVGLLEGQIQEQLSLLEEICDYDSLLTHVEEKDFSAKAGELIKLEILGKSLEKIILIGLGKPEALSIDDLREGAALASRASIGSKGKIGILFPWEPFNPISASKAVAEAMRLSIFKDLRFQSEPKPQNNPQSIDLIGLPESNHNIIKEVDPICSGVELARELVAAPPNELTPAALAEKAVEIAKKFKWNYKILNRKECEKEGMGAYLAVSQGSDLEPQFIHLTYKPNGQIKRRIAMVGKGLTFDSGGYNLKVGASQIEMMKYDMGGSAAVIGAARAIGELAPVDTEVHFIVAACENMVNGSAVHPGDIIKASNGTTIEINNTDAEGRLTLADALIYACKLEPDAIVDLATLTGACVIALGEEIAGLWVESDELANELKDASSACGEKLWRMPLQASYKEGLKSMLADIKNTGPRSGGSITAALFLKEFISNGIKWAHIDIAGTCWTDKDRGIDPAGATGFGVRTLVNWACKSNPDIEK
ncbi:MULTISPECIES: leucyl aminopeptidase [Prochlorococcus]|uniref:Probable cytosol aminopeptidase n=1 Tax=Prochlorococcus marinus (strain SARG / CCMP1375 / SS120) TaxID=167539 RepID=AMPA_PROMA|nr:MULTISPECIES: leucyl aminopeptidase [Prochlorococcus]Q7VAP4.1 RecName: Full=Probable cytosol aminopeptidase; AltName: Full=Leucine aminopeptidase; Short=LAP; AltName: Full=Leucyl aminopeptidase [Prochlorococcus marinus subsp. marinus str. CCMP1375]AAQ00457.1 Leucyl aminopeptidase [Prochlorococcus marinus subsp. marinus str. CCMP1375]KGG14338.1 Cytosol aminopeptidase PepA [Prochlorococcus marinus str. LG]KGG22088.1 Cytosol aminopeptidase PepA [Prochlorococcus marinus str. SS2]KGG24594.1 Cyto